MHFGTIRIIMNLFFFIRSVRTVLSCLDENFSLFLLPGGNLPSYQNLCLYCVGDIPITLRKATANLLGLSYPTLPAISATLISRLVFNKTAA